MDIYIYGGKLFVKDMKSVLRKADINHINIDDVEDLKDTIIQSPNSIFLIDHNKIIKHNQFIKFIKNKIPKYEKIDHFFTKDLIEQDFLDKYGVEDICFNTTQSMINYILDKINQEKTLDECKEETIKTVEDEVLQEESEEEIAERDLTSITNIEEINETEMEDALNLKSSI